MWVSTMARALVYKYLLNNVFLNNVLSLTYYNYSRIIKIEIEYVK